MMTDQEKRQKRRWSRELILEEILKLSDRSAKTNQRAFAGLYGATIRYFGSWKRAVEEAGFQYHEVTKRKTRGYWSEEILLQELRKLKWKHSNYVRKHHTGLYSAALRLFGSWEAAVKALGLDYSEVRKNSSRWLEKKFKESD